MKKKNGVSISVKISSENEENQQLLAALVAKAMSAKCG
jgi:hypothetical protein